MPSAVSGKLYTYADNFRATKVWMAAAYSGAEIKGAPDYVFSAADKAQFPHGKVPAFESDDGSVRFDDANAIAYYVANDALRHGQADGGEADKLKMSASIVGWMSFASAELEPAANAYALPRLDIAGVVSEDDKVEFCRILATLDKAVGKQKFLVGNAISLADICVVSALLLPLQFVCDGPFRKPYGNLMRWFNGIVSQAEIVKAIGEIKMCAKAPQAAAAAAKSPPKEQSKKAQQQQKQNPKKKDADDEDFDVLEPPKKAVDPFAAFPKGNFDMDDFKRFYSNNDEDKSVPYLFEKFDKEHYSVWFGQYNYPEDLTKDFMSCNLIRGMFQRLDKLRKNAFGSVCLFGSDKDASISGLWFWRGHQLAFELSDDWQVDSPSYTWTKLDYDAPETKQLMEQYLRWNGSDKQGKAFNSGMIFK